MPFSFKPNQEAEGGDVTPPPVMSSPTAPSQGVSPTPFGSIPLAERVDPEKTGILELVLYGVFSIAVVVALLLAGYQYYLNSQVDSKRDALALYETKLGGLPLEDMRNVSDRIKVINQILQRHASVSTAFRVLEDSIEHPITYTRFSLNFNPTTKSYDLQVSAVAPNYRSIVQQLDTFNKSDTYKEFIPSVAYDGVNLDVMTGKVSVNFKMPIRIEGKLPETLTFKNSTAEKPLPPVQATTTAATTTATSSPSKSAKR